ncbi:MAG: rRNA maturation RNase YbeY [Sedimentisphaerales bacterium]|nr:rRNA maturation RNase YbeY [Sedimentisphaerales bacterium]
MRGIVVHITRDFKSIVCPQQKLRKLVQAVCNRFGLANATVSIAIVGNKRISKLNSRFLNCKTVTDCLAFDLSEHRSNHSWFELVVNGEKATSEAVKRGHCAQAELALYVTHGLLHNLGLDDLLPPQAKEMHRLEDEILQQQGFGSVYDKKRKIVSNKQRQKC